MFDKKYYIVIKSPSRIFCRCGGVIMLNRYAYHLRTKSHLKKIEKKIRNIERSE